MEDKKDLSPKELEEQIQRITKYEALMGEAEQLLRTLGKYEEALAALGDKMLQLQTYYGSAEWKQDFAADEAGLLPQDLKRGVLSEDGLYQLLEEYQELRWHDGHRISFTSKDGSALLSANREGLLSLANHLVSLSTAQAGCHVHLDAENALEDGSDEIILEKAK